jgi:hypothetical protein
MKVSAFLSVLRPYSAVIAKNGNVRLATQINALGDAWELVMSWNIKDILVRAWPTEPLTTADDISVKEFREALVRLHEVIKPIAKQDFIKDLSSIVGALEPHDRADLESFVSACSAALQLAASASKKPSKQKTAKAINEELVQKLLEQLKSTYKDPETFSPIYEQLTSDKNITASEMAAIATEFAYPTPSTTKRAESLKRIWLIHESYTMSAAKTRFSGGKSAA